MRFETLPRGTVTATLDGFTVDMWKIGGGKASWNVRRNSDGVYVGGAQNVDGGIDVAKVAAVDCWRENAHPVVMT